MELDENNYYSVESNWKFFSTSQWKEFASCEARAMAKLRGEYIEQQTKALLVGSFFDSLFEGTADRFMQEHREIFTKNQTVRHTLLADFRRAQATYEGLQSDERFVDYFMGGEKQKILTFEMFGAKWKMKMDSFCEGYCICDLKYMRNFYGIPKFRYDIQGAVYQAGVKANGYGELPFYLAVVTKEKQYDHDIFQILQPELGNALAEVEMNMPRFIAVKNGEEEPHYCGTCDYCKSVKKARIRDYAELLRD